jgi:FkbM family methyltransferase
MATRWRQQALICTSILFLLILSVLGAVRYSRTDGYRARMMELIDPVLVARLQTVEDIQRRSADFEIDFFGFRYEGNTGNLVDAHAYYFGAYEKPELYFLRDTLLALGSSSVVIDVGANTGLYSLFASRYANQVHAFEPYPPVLSRLRRVIETNEVPNITVHAVGLGASEANLRFYSPPEGNLGTGSFLQGFATGNRDAHEELPIVAGDAYLSRTGITRVDFIKMDIEGYEKPALTGLQQTLQRHRPIVLLEISIDPALPLLFRSMKELTSCFPGDYEFFAISDRNLGSGAYRLGSLRVSFDRAGRVNVVARPRDKAEITPTGFGGEQASRR